MSLFDTVKQDQPAQPKKKSRKAKFNNDQNDLDQPQEGDLGQEQIKKPEVEVSAEPKIEGDEDDNIQHAIQYREMRKLYSDRTDFYYLLDSVNTRI